MASMSSVIEPLGSDRNPALSALQSRDEELKMLHVIGRRQVGRTHEGVDSGETEGDPTGVGVRDAVGDELPAVGVGEFSGIAEGALPHAVKARSTPISAKRRRLRRDSRMIGFECTPGQ